MPNLRPFVWHYGRQIGTLLGLIVLSTVLWILSPHFLTVSNLINVAQQTAINAVIAAGMTYVIITAGIDLSVGSVLALSGVVLGSALRAGIPLPMAILVALVVGFSCGLVNGLLITRGGLPPFIATLGMMSVARGAALMYTGGRPISGFSESFRVLAIEEFLHIPSPVWIMLAVYLLGHLVLTRTKLGRYAYAIGGNEQAALLSGVNTKWYKTLVYGLSGMLSGLAAVILTARLNSAQPIAGIMYELDAIAATVIGGTSLMGGEGRVVGTLVGALIMGVLRNGLNLLGVSSFLQQIVIGSVIIVAVLIDMALKRQK
ncbi:MAG: ribose ABC transporter permease [Acidobacteria bacterium]|nr:MAG: ribose ABC transporter permease [Acidobacteriota bacterium]